MIQQFFSYYDIDFLVQLIICMTIVTLTFGTKLRKARIIGIGAILTAGCTFLNTLVRTLTASSMSTQLLIMKEIRFCCYILLLFIGISAYSVLVLNGSKRQFAATALFIINACDLSISLIRIPLNSSTFSRLGMYVILFCILMIYRHVTFPIDAKISNFYYAFLIATPIIILAVERFYYFSTTGGGFLFVVPLLLLLLDFSIYFLFCHLSKEIRENFNLSLENSHMHQQIDQLESTEDVLKTIRQERHELKNNYFVLDSFLQQKKYDELAQYLHQTMMPRL